MVYKMYEAMISNYQLFKFLFVESAKVAKSVATKM